MNIGYMKIMDKDPRGTWELRDKNGKLLERGHCIECTLKASNYGMKILTVH